MDQGNLAILETVDDVHVLTGALKLFFRELKEPLILWEVVDKLLMACNHQVSVLLKLFSSSFTASQNRLIPWQVFSNLS